MLMTVVREELSLTNEQVGWCIIASVSATVFARLVVGWLCDRVGPRLTYTWLLVLGSLPVMGIGFAYDFETFLVFRLLIGAIGASFVITQYHTSVMFAPNCVGTASATSAGWGNLGGGVTQLAMPLVFMLFVGGLGFSTALGWRASMVTAGVVCLLTGLAYYRFTQDAPDGNFKQLRAAGKMPSVGKSSEPVWNVCKDYRVWALFVIYGACFGLELTMCNVAALYFADYFGFSILVKMAQGATFSIVPFVNKRALGSVAGIVGAGGNAGAVAAGFLFKSGIHWPTALLILGGLVTASSLLALLVRFTPEVESAAARDLSTALAEKRRTRPTPPLEPALTS